MSSQLDVYSAPLWRRALAFVYDLFLLCAISMCYGGIVLIIYVVIYGAPADGDYQPLVGGVLFQIGWVLSLCFFYCFFWLRGGQTAGMRAWRLKLININGEKIGLATCLKRIAIGIPSFFVFGLGYLWKFIDKNNDCLHDKLSQTRVAITEKNNKKNIKPKDKK